MKVKNKKTGKVEDVRLPKGFKKKWITALLSDKFEQSTDYLFDEYNNGYCCLGVACRIIHPKLKLNFVRLITKKDFGKKYVKIKVPKILHGNADKSGKIFNPIVLKLAGMNDDGKSFKQIAAYIEKNL